MANVTYGSSIGSLSKFMDSYCLDSISLCGQKLLVAFKSGLSEIQNLGTRSDDRIWKKKALWTSLCDVSPSNYVIARYTCQRCRCTALTSQTSSVLSNARSLITSHFTLAKLGRIERQRIGFDGLVGVMETSNSWL